YLALAGYDTQEMADTLPVVLNLAAAGSIDLADASDMVTDAMSALGMGTDEASTMVDQMSKTASTTNTSVAQLGEGILKIGATAKSIKGGTAELNTALGILANNGIKGAEGGTHLRNVILALQSPTDTAASCMESLGLQVYDSEGNMRSLNDILSDLNASMDGMTSEEKNNIISTIFNKTDLSSVNALLANTGETWDELQQSITDSGGAAQQMADTQLDNLSGQITILKSALEGLAIAFGETLMPAIKKIVSAIQGFVDKLNSKDENQRKLIVTIAAVVAAIGPLLVII
ncbi:MAG: phage tail tape measure protein, partial [Lachnospiraceae bacterium]|nr:phage tail tape measure protein [Lachnospiraceae bacterium]